MGDKTQRASALSPIHTVFGHGLCNLCHHRIKLFLLVQVSIVTCYGNHAKTSSRDLYNIKP